MSDLPVRRNTDLELVGDLVLPLVALAIGAWLAWRFRPGWRGHPGSLRGGDGIQANKTEVLYKGISVGKVTDLHVSKDIRRAWSRPSRSDKEARQYLSKDSRFWLVKLRSFPGWRHRPGNPGLRRLHRGRSGEGRRKNATSPR